MHYNKFPRIARRRGPASGKAAVVGALVSLSLLPACAEGPSDGALLDLLQKKGLISAKEAADVRSEADKDFSKRFRAQTGLPEYVSSLKFSGDFRGRYEGHYGDDPAFVQRDRFRYRLRIGAVATLKEDFEVGLRLSSGDPVGGFSNNAGNPLSGSGTFQDNGTRKFVYFDLAYAKWTGLKTDSTTGSISFGKIENPFSFSHNVFDPDYNPEGLAAQVSYAVNEHHTVKGILGAFVLDELSASSRDPYLAGGQVILDSKWTPKIATSLAGGVLSISSVRNLSNAGVPNVNRGNTRDPITTAPSAGFNPIIADASATYTLDSFPTYSGKFPIKASGEFLHNPAASSANQAWMGGLTFGKAGKKGQWELAYQYRYLGADSWYEELPDDDFVGYYQTQLPNAGFAGTGAGYGGGTNLRGHWVKASYAITDAVTFALTVYNAELTHESPAGSKSGVTHIMADLVWKF